MGCEVDILPPHRPDLKPFVERYQRSLKTECLNKHHPATAAEANEVIPAYTSWFNQVRPHQGRDLHDQPPAQRLAQAAPRAAVPEIVDPDAWLTHFHQRHYRRHVDSRGTIQLWKYTYYIGQAYANQTVLVRLDAVRQMIYVEVGRTSPSKPCPCKA